MARRTLTITKLQYWKKHARGAKKVPQDVGALPDKRDFLHLVYGMWMSLPEDGLMDKVKKRYRDPLPLDETDTFGRYLVMSAEVGAYGEPGAIIDTETRLRAVEDHRGTHAQAGTLRAMLFVPERGTSALLFIEHSGHRSFGGALLEVIKKVWARDYPEWTLHTETLTRAEAWLSFAQLEAVEAQIWNYSPDLADAGSPKHLGTLKAFIVPERGQRYLPHAVLESLRDSTIAKAGLLGLQQEPDELRVKVGDGEQSKTYVVGDERTPPIRLLLNDDGTPPLTKPKFIDFCLDEARTTLPDVGTAWDTSWTRGAWSADALQMRVAVEDVLEDGD